MDRFFVAAGAISAALAQVFGAFGAHALKARIAPDLLVTFEIGARYHMYAALGTVAAGLTLARWPGAPGTWAGWLFLAGTVLFSGSLYVLAVTGVRALGAVTPFGGLAFIAGWIALALAALRTTVRTVR